MGRAPNGSANMTCSADMGQTGLYVLVSVQLSGYNACCDCHTGLDPHEEAHAWPALALAFSL